MPTFKVNIDLKNTEKLKKIAKNIFDDESEYTISLLLNRYITRLN
jgi:hypothetical protein